MKLIVVGAAFLLAGSFCAAAPALAQQICPGLTGQARTDCLRQEQSKAAAAAAYANAYSDSLNKSMKNACDVAQSADAAARLMQRSPNTPVKLAGRTWTSARSLADFALGQSGECNRLRQELARAQRR